MKRDQHLYTVILAGGSGTRFWPMSRQAKPKQFLNVRGGLTLFQETLKRVVPAMDPDRIYVVTNKAYRRELIRQAAAIGVTLKHVLLEPHARNTAAAIAWPTYHIHQRDPQAVTLVLPSDHLIMYPKKFLSAVARAVRMARKDYLVLFGIVPSRPETGYGYLKVRKTKDGHVVSEFKEKPNLATAKRFVRQKNFYWNSGMFVWSTRTMIRNIEEHLPRAARVFERGVSPAFVHKNWTRLPKISIDFGILERADRVAAVPADIGWSDLGSWESLFEVLPADKDGNLLRGDVVAVESGHSLVFGHKKLIATAGVQDLVVVDTPDALLIMPREKSQMVKQIVDRLKDKRRAEV